MKKELFKEYADVKNEIKVLTAKAKEIEESVTGEMNKEEVDKVESDFGTFYFTTRKKWTYSDAVTSVEKTVKETKKKEEEDGTATAEETKSLTFRGK